MMQCPCGGETKDLYRKGPSDDTEVMATQCRACGRESRKVIAKRPGKPRG